MKIDQFDHGKNKVAKMPEKPLSQAHPRSGTVNSKSFIGKVLLRIKWKFELTVHFKQEMIGKHFTETLNKVQLRINSDRINHVRPVYFAKAMAIIVG